MLNKLVKGAFGLMTVVMAGTAEEHAAEEHKTTESEHD